MEKWNCKKEVIGKYFYLTGFTIELFFMLYNLGAYPVPEWLNIGRVMQLAFILFGCKLFLTNYTKKEIIAMSFLFLIGMISFLATGRNMWVLRVEMLILSSKGIDTKKLLKYVLLMTSVGVIAIITLSLFGVGADFINAIDYGRDAGVEARWTFGMGHPNHAHGVFCYLIILFLYLYYEHLKWYHFAGLAILNQILFMLTVSRTGMLIAMIAIIMFIIIKYSKSIRESKLLPIGATLCIIGIVLFVIVVAYVGTEHEVLDKLDKLFTGRLYFIRKYGDPDTWSLFKPAASRGPGINDVAFASLVNEFGFAPLLLYVITNILYVRYCWVKRDMMAIIVVISYTLFGLMENYLNAYYPLYNLIYIFFIGTWNEFCVKESNEV